MRPVGTEPDGCSTKGTSLTLRRGGSDYPEAGLIFGREMEDMIIYVLTRTALQYGVSFGGSQRGANCRLPRGEEGRGGQNVTFTVRRLTVLDTRLVLIEAPKSPHRLAYDRLWPGNSFSSPFKTYSDCIAKEVCLPVAAAD